MKASLRKAGLKEAFFQTGPVRLHYVFSESSHPPLLLFPGQSVSWESYQRVLPGLAKHFQVFALDVHGHGQTSWNPERYDFNSIGQDMAAFLRERVGRPAFLTGNSSGGLIALWLAAHEPDWVLGVIPEDPPLFSAEWPRLRDSCFVYSIFERCHHYLKDTQNRDLAGFFAGLEVPVQGRITPLKLPPALSFMLVKMLQFLQARHPHQAIELPAFFPATLQVFVKGLSEYDPAFSAAFLEGQACRNFDHAQTLAQIQCPVLLLHAHWFEHPQWGLVGAMNAEDVQRTRQALKVPFQYLAMQTEHMSHLTRPQEFIRAILNFTRRLE